jgi:hypothetical protein
MKRGAPGGLNRRIQKIRGVLARYAPQNSKVTLHIVNDSRMRALCAYYRRCGRIEPTELASNCGNAAQQLSQ